MLDCRWAARGEGAGGGGEEESVTSRWALRGRNIEQKVREAVVAVGSGEGVRGVRCVALGGRFD
eukprot:COSAG01_NODE_6662_length_3558_cov_44.707430_2_plen_64_part_00